MKTNPKVELSGVAEGKWIRMTAEAVLDESIAAQEHMLAAYPSLQTMYHPGDGNTEGYWLKNATARICAFTEPTKTITF